VRASGQAEAACRTPESRDFSALTISYKAPRYDIDIPWPDGSRPPFSGNPNDIAGDIRTFATSGVHEWIFDFPGQSIAESIERLQRFTTEMTPLVGGFRLSAWNRPPPPSETDSDAARGQEVRMHVSQPSAGALL
jgi:hypothetical protein